MSERLSAPGLRHPLWWWLCAGLPLVLWVSGLVLFEPLAAHLPEAFVLAWRHALASTHGVVASWSILLLGAVLSRHAWPAYKAGRLRWSGVALAGVWLLLAASGQVVQYGSDGAGRDSVAALHGWVGVFALLVGVAHLGRWLRRRGHRAARALTPRHHPRKT